MRKRFGLRKTFIGVTITAVALVALAVAGSGLATSSGFDANATYTSIAGTDLHASQVGASSDNFTSECSSDELSQISDGEVLWHFVLVQTTALNTGALRAEFDSAGVTSPDVGYLKFVGGVVHWDVITPSSDTLLNASTDADGAILNLSHVCGGGGSGGQTSSISTTVHLGQSDSGTPTVVDNANPAALGSYLHDSANLTFTGGGTLPSGSTVYFSFFTNNDCTAPPADTTDVDVGGEDSPATGLDPRLVAGPLGAGSYSYVAVFVSGDSSVVGDSIGDCEPFMISQGTPSTSTEIHRGQTDSGAPVVIPPAGIDPGGYVHDSATVTGVAGFVPTGTVSFTWYTNGTCYGTGTAAGTVALNSNGVADPSTAEGPLAPGNYSFKASYSGDINYTSGDPSACEPLHVFNYALTPGYWKTHLTLDRKHPDAPYTAKYLPICLGGTWNGTDCTGGYLGKFAVKTTTDATNVFNAMNCSNTGSNSTLNQNAVGCLAGHLLAAKLNVANGTNTCITTTIGLADAALSGDHYIGPSGNYTGIANRAYLITLKTALDKYNNGGGC
jgi:hypothetical protein